MILDARGNPIQPDKTILSEDIARAVVTSVRNPRPPSVASTLTPHRLAGLLRSVIEGTSPADYMALAEEIEERDLHYASVLRTRKLAVAALPPSVEAASDEPADLEMAERVRELMDADTIPELLFDLLDGLGKGVSVVQILWATSAARWQPTEFRWVDPRYLRPDPETLGDIRLISDAYPQGQPLEPYKFIVHTPRTKSGSIWRNGLARLCAVMYMLKSFTVRDWWAFAEVFGIPVRIGKYGPNATPEQRQTLVSAISQIASDAGAVIPESMQIELIESAKGNGGQTLFENMARWCDEQVSKAVLGQTMTTDNGSSLSQAQVHNDVRMDIARWDARQLEATINEYLVKPWIILNWGPQARYPRVTLQVPEPEDLKLLVDSITPLIDRGMRVEASELRDKFGLSDPAKDADLLQPLSAMQQPAPLALNRQQGQRMAINRIQQPGDQLLSEMEDAAMNEWAEMGGEDFMDPILEMAKEATSFEEFNEKLLELHSEQSIKAIYSQFTYNMAKMMFQARGLGDSQDA